MGFSDYDRKQSLSTAGTGCWRLESEPDKPVRFYGDTILNQLLGVEDDLDPVKRMEIFFSRIYEEDMPLFMDYYNTLKAKQRAEVVYRYKHPTLGTIYVRCGGARDFTVTEFACYRGFHQNVNDTVRVEQETANRKTYLSELYRTIAFKLMEHASDSAVVINTKDGTFQCYSFNGAPVPNQTDYSEMINGYSRYVPEEYRDEYLKNTSIENLTEQLAQKDAYSFSSFIYRITDGRLSRVNYQYYSMNNNPNTIISIFQDTTEDYEKEIQLENALKNAEAANRAKTVFLNNMSHDIRTPMNAVIGFTELAEKNIDDKDKTLDYLEKIRVSSKHLLSLINDVLDMSRIESGRMKLVMESVSISEIMNGLNTVFLNDATQKGLDFTVDYDAITDDYVLSDKLRLNQILLNCISNSIKFTNEGGRVAISAIQLVDESLPQNYARYQFSIEDSGIGMSEEYLKRIFDPFSREENKVHQIPGTGLGMSICKSIVDLMGGTIEVTSELGKGTTFKILLNLEKTESAAVKNTTDEDLLQSDSLAGTRILLVEDNEINREIAIEILRDTGVIIECAENGKIAVDKIINSDEYYYDIVLMDIQMPIMNGYEATRAIRELPRSDIKDLAIVAMTANAFEEDKQKAIEAGMNNHLTKPINIAELMKTLRYYSNRRKDG